MLYTKLLKATKMMQGLKGMIYEELLRFVQFNKEETEVTLIVLYDLRESRGRADDLFVSGDRNMREWLIDARKEVQIGYLKKVLH